MNKENAYKNIMILLRKYSKKNKTNQEKISSEKVSNRSRKRVRYWRFVPVPLTMLSSLLPSHFFLEEHPECHQQKVSVTGG
jgi:hypothetical protein